MLSLSTAALYCKGTPLLRSVVIDLNNAGCRKKAWRCLPGPAYDVAQHVGHPTPNGCQMHAVPAKPLQLRVGQRLQSPEE
eukprot:3707331-Lingulodinium_polyedra.AAC.1